LSAVCVPGAKTGRPVAFARTGFSPSTVPEFAVSPNTEIVNAFPSVSVDGGQMPILPSASGSTARGGMPEYRKRCSNANRCRTSHPGPFSAFRSSRSAESTLRPWATGSPARCSGSRQRVVGQKAQPVGVPASHVNVPASYQLCALFSSRLMC